MAATRDAIRRASVVSRGDDKRAIPAATPPCRRSPAEQWDRVAAILLEAQSRAARACDRQHAASRQIDAATYALQRLREEVAPALHFTVAHPPRPAVTPTAFRRDAFRRSEPLAA